MLSAMQSRAISLIRGLLAGIRPPCAALILVVVSLPQSNTPIYARPSIRRVLRIAAVVGLILGIETTILHALADPLGDVRAYYDAGARLNAGQLLYVQTVDADDAAFYRYPPLLAVVFGRSRSCPMRRLPRFGSRFCWSWPR